MYNGAVLQYNTNTGYGKILSSCNLLVSVYHENIYSSNLYKYLVPNEYVTFDIVLDEFCYSSYYLLYKAINIKGMFDRKLICDLKYKRSYENAWITHK